MMKNFFIKIKVVMKKKRIWIILLILILIAGSSFYFGKNQAPKEDPFMSFLNQQYNGKSLVRTFDPIGKFIISSATSNKAYFDENSNGLDEKATPSIIVTDANNLQIKSIYEISFTYKGKENRGNLITQAEAKQIKDFFLSEWVISWGGSNGLKGFVLFGIKDGQLQPITGYPFDFTKDDSINLTDKITGKKYSFPIDIDSVFSEVTDLNNDGKVDLLYADYIWDLKKGEAHYEPRPWYLRVYELKDNKFTVANWWNKGQEFTTTEKIGYTEADTVRLRQIFYEKSK